MKVTLYIAALILVYTFAQERDAQDRAYTQNLERVLATCVASSSGGPIYIGNELHMCGATPTGIKF
jgi:hypothetical protein